MQKDNSKSQKRIDWYNISWQEVVERLDSNEQKGLSAKEVKKRQEEFGKNSLPEEKPLSKLEIFFDQFKSPLIYILVVAGIITLILRHFTDSIVILSAVFLNTIVGFIQENKASQTLRALKKIVKHQAEVLREENLKIIDSEEVVPGDIVILTPGDRVPADGRIIDCYNLKINEMALTGEWLAANKSSESLPEKTPLADRDNMVYMGTIVEDGKAKVVITGTGLKTEIGKVASMVKEAKEEKTPYQKKLAHFSKMIGIVIGLICFGIFIEGMITGGEFVEMFTTAVAVAVAAIPEGLPVAMTVILALGMYRISKKQGLVRKLSSAETLGSTSVICTDKTATLTQGKMKVDEIIGDSLLSLKIATSNSQAFIENPDQPKENWVIRGRPTEKSLIEAASEAGITKKDLDKKEEKIAELPFDPVYKYSLVLRKISDNENALYVLGAPEKILKMSAHFNFVGKEEALSEEKIKDFTNKFESLAAKGKRILAAAYKKYKADDTKYEKLEDLCKDLVFTGLISLHDPLRPEVREAIQVCRQAGMKPIIVTGDHKLTAKAIAQELGFKIEEGNILEGTDLDEISDKKFEEILDKIQIYARVEPKHKMRIIDAWQDKGEVVAMTGDGVNDAPALKKADIGVAIGSGTEVAKETSDLILLNDSFSIIVSAIEEGRVIIDNIRKVITYLLSDSFCEVILIGGSMLVGWLTHRPWFLPVTAVQILWVNLIEDGLPDIALAFEPKEKDIMLQKPKGHVIPLLTREMKFIIFIIGIITDVFLLLVFFWLFNQDFSPEYIRTVIFAMLGFDSISYVFSCKSLRRNIWHTNPFDNKILVIAWLLGFSALLAAIYLPALNNLLKTVPLPLSAWWLIVGLGFLNVILIEATKWYFIVRKEL
jgi:Ca2+-transporting ATPase